MNNRRKLLSTFDDLINAVLKYFKFCLHYHSILEQMNFPERKTHSLLEICSFHKNLPFCSLKIYGHLKTKVDLTPLIVRKQYLPFFWKAVHGGLLFRGTWQALKRRCVFNPQNANLSYHKQRFWCGPLYLNGSHLVALKPAECDMAFCFCCSMCTDLCGCIVLFRRAAI